MSYMAQPGSEKETSKEGGRRQDRERREGGREITSKEGRKQQASKQGRGEKDGREGEKDGREEGNMHKRTNDKPDIA